MLYVIGVILGVLGLRKIAMSSKPGNNGAMPTAKVGDEQTDVEKGENHVVHSINAALNEGRSKIAFSQFKFIVKILYKFGSI